MNDPVEVHPHEGTPDEQAFDEYTYDHSLSNRLKQGWIVFQVCMMTIYMIIGIRSYCKVQSGWNKVNTLFAFQTFCILYLLINEFTHRHINGLFLILLFTQYSMFLAFCLVMDSCITEADDQQVSWKTDKLKSFNRIFRIACHCITFALFISSFFMQDCHTAIYPTNFVAVVFLILCHQVYDIYLSRHGYLIDWENLPFMSKNKLRFNKELFEKQSKCLLYGNLVFGVISVLTVASGYFIINRQNQPGTKQHLLCLRGFEWVYLGPIGNIFGTLHQLLILMQINITQYVLVRIPRNMGLFEHEDMKHALADGLRSKLLDTAINEGENKPDNENDDDGYKNADGTISLGKLLRKIKESQKKQNDNFRA